MSSSSPTRKLIEVSLPLEEINRESAREKEPFTRNHPRSLHIWWARRPLATARAVLFAQLVDDPSSHPDRFPTAEDQRRERERLHDIIRRLVQWENVGNEALLREAHVEIAASAPDGVAPTILDPFAGGGAIPLEAQRLGLEAHASDLNPVAVLINKALIEIPPKFANRPPVFPGAAEEELGDWPRATGLAEDVRRYGGWMRDRAAERIGHIYPKATLPDGSEAAVTAWIWARTVTCPNPACGIKMPLVRSWWLGKKKGKEAYVVPAIVPDGEAPSGRRVAFSIGHDLAEGPAGEGDGTVGRTGAVCIACITAVDFKYVRAEATQGRMGASLMAVVTEGNRERIYLAPSSVHESAANVSRPGDTAQGSIPPQAPSFRVQAYGMTEWIDLFTNRQLVALTTFSDLVTEVRDEVLRDALASGCPEGDRLEVGDIRAAAYADAVATYLGLILSRCADMSNSLTSWNSSNENVRALFSRQAVPMVWDYPEVNSIGKIGLLATLESVAKIIATFPTEVPGSVDQGDARRAGSSGEVVSTDPPYYDNIGYSDLSDFFYVWLRRTLRSVHPSLLETILVPKLEELVANPYRHGGKHGAETYFEEGFQHVFAQMRRTARADYPISVYYAFKQAELEREGISSTGWATLLEGMISAGWSITATWPARTERANRMIASGTNALASSIVLALRPRHETARATTRRGFIAALKSTLPRALTEMQQGAIAPVDLAQATIGPGMAVFSSYAKVLEADGSAMSVKTALALINQALDEVLAEQDGELDPDTRFAVDWYRQYGWESKPFGEADVLARAKDTSVAGLARGGVLTSADGKVALIRPTDLDSSWNPANDDRVSLWEATLHLARSYATEGGETTARLLSAVGKRVDLDAVQLLAYRLYELSQATRPQDALLFNGLGQGWSDLTSTARTVAPAATQGSFDLSSES